LEMLFYSITVMKYKKVNSKQSVVIYLRNARGLKVRTMLHFQRFIYSLPNTPSEPFLAEFNPASNWKDIGAVVKKIFVDLCLEVGFDISEEDANRQINETLRQNFYVFQSHDYSGAHSHIILQAIKVSEFGLEKVVP
jgi:hypothetical protein